MKTLLPAAAAALLLIPASGAAADDQATPRPGTSPSPVRASGPQLPSRVFIDVNGAYQSGDVDFTDTRNEDVFGETASWSADYTVKSGPAFDVSGGVRVWRNLVAAVAFSQYSDTNLAPIVGRVPHPFFFSRDREFSGESSGLRHKEQAIHAGLSWTAPVGRHVEVRAFGGPSFFRLERDLIADVEYSESYPYDTADFGSATVENLKKNTIGYHAGADVTWLFTRALGVGVLVRFTRAESSWTSPASGSTIGIYHGGLQVGAGIRLRFGGAPASRPPARRQAAPRPAAVPAPGNRAAESAPAQDVRDTAVAKVDVDVFVRPGALEPIRQLAAGTRVRVREQQGEWLMIEFRDPQWGPRVGFVRRDQVEW